MALDKNDLKAIKQIVSEEVDSRATKTETYLKDYVGFAIEKSEQKMEAKFDEMGADIKEIKRNIDDMIETDNAFLGYLGNHEKRIVRVEKKLGLKVP